MSVYLYDLQGRVIAFRRTWDDPHLFDLGGDWVGWQSLDGTDVVGEDGHYVGSVVGDRLVRRNDCVDRVVEVPAEHPVHAEPDGRPTAPLPFPSRFAYDDVEGLRRSG